MLKGEASARPHLRLSSFRETHFFSMIQGALRAMNEHDTKVSLQGGFLFLLLDGKEHSRGDRMMKAFTGSDGKMLPKGRYQIFLQTTEKSEREHKGKVRGLFNLKTLEIINLVTQEGDLAFPIRDHINCPGSNASDSLGPFDRPTKAQTWHVRHGDKSRLYGASLVLVGGRPTIETDLTDDPPPKAGELVPFTYHGHTKVYEEFIHTYNLKCIWDLTASDPTLPLVCIRAKKGYFGFCHTVAHKEALRKEIVNQIFAAFRQASDPLYEQQLVTMLTRQTSTTSMAAAPATPLMHSPAAGSATMPAEATQATTAGGAVGGASDRLTSTRRLQHGEPNFGSTQHAVNFDSLPTKNAKTKTLLVNHLLCSRDNSHGVCWRLVA